MNKVICVALGLLIVLTLGSPLLCADDGSAEELPAANDGRIISYRLVPINETLPQLGARLYDNVTYQGQLRRLKAEIQLAEAQLEAHRERTAFYDKNFSRTPALLLTRQNARLAELSSELRLKELRKQKQVLLQYRQDLVRYRQLVIAQGDVVLSLDE
jgi:hypothetical protein